MESGSLIVLVHETETEVWISTGTDIVYLGKGEAGMVDPTGILHRIEWPLISLSTINPANQDAINKHAKEVIDKSLGKGGREGCNECEIVQ